MEYVVTGNITKGKYKGTRGTVMGKGRYTKVYPTKAAAMKKLTQIKKLIAKRKVKGIRPRISQAHSFYLR